MLKFGHPKVAVVPLLGILFSSVGVLAATAGMAITVVTVTAILGVVISDMVISATASTLTTAAGNGVPTARSTSAIAPIDLRR